MAKVEIVRMGRHGEGVGQWTDGRTVFVPRALPGEVVEAAVESDHPRWVRAHAQKWLASSPERVQPPCPVAEQCGGCAFQHWQYGAELAYKADRVRQAVRRIAGVADPPLEPMVGAPDPYHYRNKGQFPWGWESGAPRLGLYAQGTHHLIGLDQCAIQDDEVNAVLAPAEQLAGELGLTVYDEARRQGLLRHLLVRSSRDQGQSLVVIVATTWDDRLRVWARRLMQRVPRIAGVGANLNHLSGNRILGPQTIALAGADHLVESLLGLRFRLSFTSFFQVHPVQVERLYQQVLDQMPAGAVAAWDLYSGVGTLAALAAKRVPEVWALESNPAAVADALTNFELNGLQNVHAQVGTAETLLPRWARQRSRPSVLIADPPRSGMKPEVVAAIRRLRAPRVVYVSCDPETLARDLRLVLADYALSRLVPVDMFPRTDHVEVVATLDLR